MPCRDCDEKRLPYLTHIEERTHGDALVFFVWCAFFLILFGSLLALALGVLG